jgi:microcystin-dependent protein
MQQIRFAIATVFLILACVVSPAHSSEALFIDANGDATFSGSATVNGTIRGIGMTPPGGIIMFSGDVAKAFDANGTGLPNTPYEGWQLCNGNNNSPDLRDRFIAAAGGKYKISDSGGSDTVTLTSSQMPVHRHTAQAVAGGVHIHNIQRAHSGTLRYTWKNGESTTTVKAGAGGKEYDKAAPLTTDYQGQHTHSINISDTGGNQPHENRPLFYALAFIMRLPLE